jgi:hypothetical protein
MELSLEKRLYAIYAFIIKVKGPVSGAFYFYVLNLYMIIGYDRVKQDVFRYLIHR